MFSSNNLRIAECAERYSGAPVHAQQSEPSGVNLQENRWDRMAPNGGFVSRKISKREAYFLANSRMGMCLVSHHQSSLGAGRLRSGQTGLQLFRDDPRRSLALPADPA